MEDSTSTLGDVVPAAMVVAAIPPGRGGENPGWGSGPRAFWGLMDLTHLAGLAPDSQGVASSNNRENREGRLDATTNGMTRCQ